MTTVELHPNFGMRADTHCKKPCAPTGDSSVTTVLSADEWDVDSIEDDETLQCIIEQIKEKLDQMDVSESSIAENTSLSGGIQKKRLQSCRSLARLHNRMRISKTLGFGQHQDFHPPATAVPPTSVPPTEDPSPTHRSIEELRRQKKASLRNLIRKFDSICDSRAAIAA